MAAVVAGVVSGAPSTAMALAAGESPLAAARAAGALLGRPGLVRGAAAHGVVSLGWGVVLARLLPARRTVAAGAAAGLAIAALDLGIAARRYPAISALDQRGQVLDHVAFGAVVGMVVARRREAPTTR